MAQFNYSVQQDMPTLGAPSNYISALSTTASESSTTTITVVWGNGSTQVQPVRGLLRVRGTAASGGFTAAISAVAVESSSGGPSYVIASIPASVALSTSVNPVGIDYLIPFQTDNTNGLYSIQVAVTLTSGTMNVDVEAAGNP